MKRHQPQILEELYYERLKTQQDLERLLVFDLDLQMSIERAVSGIASSERKRRVLADESLRRALSRVRNDNEALDTQ